MENEKRQILINHIEKHIRHNKGRENCGFEWDKNNAEVYRIALAALNSEHHRSLGHREFLLLSADQVQREYAEALGCAGDNESILEAIDVLKEQVRTVDLSNGVLNQRIAEQGAIVAAAEKLVRCKGRYHSELNYRALSKLFGITTPDLPPLEHENVHYADAAEMEIAALRQRIAELEARAFNPAILDVIAERQRQKAVEGWTSEHDDLHDSGELAGAAACYAHYTNARGWVFPTNPGDYQSADEPNNWPWDPAWWKPTNPRRDLVKAGALILAEIERIDRAAGINVEAE
ncbi:hypothetical protein [Citrobacter sp. CK196]|uniref:hypothetical protein n=1 Tax=Citrobacter sp. CK196 TaxID=2985105 RepID=UPI003369F92A